MSKMPEFNKPNPSGNTARYAIYFCPRPSAPLYGQGSRWLGRDAATGVEFDPDLPDYIQCEEWLRATESPRRYGFHATLKPPFRLAEGATYENLRAALHEFAKRHECFCAPSLHIETLGRFLALTLSVSCDEFSDLAADCVREFDRFRLPPTEAELAQRMRDSLSPREREYLLQWGYPYVLDTWKFHMSLTGSLPPEALPPLEQYLRQRFASVCGQALLVDSVCIFHESHPGAPFQLLDRVNLRSS
jgi:putative phosphonate metabolism protein